MISNSEAPKKLPSEKFSPGAWLSTPSIIWRDLTGEVLLNPLVLITLKPRLADEISTPFKDPSAS